MTLDGAINHPACRRTGHRISFIGQINLWNSTRGGTTRCRNARLIFFIERGSSTALRSVFLLFLFFLTAKSTDESMMIRRARQSNNSRVENARTHAAHLSAFPFSLRVFEKVGNEANLSDDSNDDAFYARTMRVCSSVLT
jgi:hypothetical protein